MIDARLKRAGPPKAQGGEPAPEGSQPGGGGGGTGAMSGEGGNGGAVDGEDAFAGIVEPPPDDEPGTFDEEILFRLDALLELPHPVDKLSPVYLEGKDGKLLHSCTWQIYILGPHYLYLGTLTQRTKYFQRPHPHLLSVVIKVVHSLASGAEPSQFAFDQEALIAHGNGELRPDHHLT